MFVDRQAGPGRPRLISLSHVNDPAMTNVYPGDPPFELETVATIEDERILPAVRQTGRAHRYALGRARPFQRG